MRNVCKCLQPGNGGLPDQATCTVELHAADGLLPALVTQVTSAVPHTGGAGLQQSAVLAAGALSMATKRLQSTTWPRLRCVVKSKLPPDGRMQVAAARQRLESPAASGDLRGEPAPTPDELASLADRIAAFLYRRSGVASPRTVEAPPPPAPPMDLPGLVRLEALLTASGPGLDVVERRLAAWLAACWAGAAD